MEIRQLHASPAATARGSLRARQARPSGRAAASTRQGRLSSAAPAGTRLARALRLVPPASWPVASSAPSHAASGGS
jgi:hypothetical protein